MSLIDVSWSLDFQVLNSHFAAPLFSELIEDAEREFHEATEEEVQRRFKDQTKPETEEHEGKAGHKKKRSRAKKADTQETTGQQQDENSDQKNENGLQRGESGSGGTAVAKLNEKSSFAEL